MLITVYQKELWFTEYFTNGKQSHFLHFCLFVRLHFIITMLMLCLQLVVAPPKVGHNRYLPVYVIGSVQHFICLMVLIWTKRTCLILQLYTDMCSCCERIRLGSYFGVFKTLSNNYSQLFSVRTDEHRLINLCFVCSCEILSDLYLLQTHWACRDVTFSWLFYPKRLTIVHQRHSDGDAGVSVFLQDASTRVSPARDRTSAPLTETQTC